MRWTTIVITAALASPLAGQEPPPLAPAPLPSVTLPSALERVLRDYERGWAGGDAAGLAGLFTEDGFVLSSGRPPIRGREAIRERYANVSGDLRLRALASVVADTVGYIVGAYRYGTAPEDRGKFVLALRRAPGGPWLIAADIDNSNERR